MEESRGGCVRSSRDLFFIQPQAEEERAGPKQRPRTRPCIRVALRAVRVQHGLPHVRANRTVEGFFLLAWFACTQCVYCLQHRHICTFAYAYDTIIAAAAGAAAAAVAGAAVVVAAGAATFCLVGMQQA